MNTGAAEGGLTHQVELKSPIVAGKNTGASKGCLTHQDELKSSMQMAISFFHPKEGTFQCIFVILGSGGWQLAATAVSTCCGCKWLPSSTMAPLFIQKKAHCNAFLSFWALVVGNWQQQL